MLANRESARRRQEALPGGEARGQGPESGEGLLTRPGLARALGVSLRTVDRMLADEEITPIEIHGWSVRFELEAVLKELRAGNGKWGRAARLKAKG